MRFFCCLLPVACCLFFLAGCGGGGGDTPPPPLPPVDTKTEVETLITTGWDSHDKNKDEAAAISNFSKAVEKCVSTNDDQCARSYSGIGYSYLALGNADSALTNFTAAVQKSSTLTEAYAGLALVADAKDSYADMVTYTAKVESLDASFALLHSPYIKMVDIYVIAARGYLASGNLCSFKKYYDKAVAADPNNTSVKQLATFYNSYAYTQYASCP